MLGHRESLQRVVEKNHVFHHRISLPSLFPFSFAVFLISLQYFCSLSSLFFSFLSLILFSLSAHLTLRLCRGTCQTHSPSFWTNTCSYDLMYRPFCLHGSFPLQGILTPAFSPRVAGKSVGEAQHVREQQRKSGEPLDLCREPSTHISRDLPPNPCKENRTPTRGGEQASSQPWATLILPLRSTDCWLGQWIVMREELAYSSKPGWLQSMGLQRVRHDWRTEHTHTHVAMASEESKHKGWSGVIHNYMGFIETAFHQLHWERGQWGLSPRVMSLGLSEFQFFVWKPQRIISTAKN